jgi:hypothetical protein
MAASRAEDLAVGQYLAFRHKSQVRDRQDATAGLRHAGPLQPTMTPAAPEDCADGSQKRLQECPVQQRTMR